MNHHHYHSPMVVSSCCSSSSYSYSYLLLFLRFFVRSILFFLPGVENQQNSFHRKRFDIETEYEMGRTELEMILVLILSYGCFGCRLGLHLLLLLLPVLDETSPSPSAFLLCREGYNMVVWMLAARMAKKHASFHRIEELAISKPAEPRMCIFVQQKLSHALSSCW
jgi:hypothetical protein